MPHNPETTTATPAPVRSAAEPEPLAADPRRWFALALISVATLMIVLDSSIVTIALPHAQTDLHISPDNRQWVVTAYTLPFGGLLLIGGRIADFVGRKRVFLIGLIGFAGASALGAAAVDQAILFSAAPCKVPSPPSLRRRPCPCSRSPSPMPVSERKPSASTARSRALAARSD